MVNSLQKIVGVSLVVLLAACSNDQSYKQQANGDDDYLKAPALKELHAPAGMILPAQNGQYAVNNRPVAEGRTGMELDIRPPSQPLALVSGSRVQSSSDSATLSLENSADNKALWSQLIDALDQKGYKITDRQDANKTLTTDWVDWQRNDENAAYSARYQISVQSQGYQNQLSVKTLELKSGDKSVSDIASSSLQRYSINMLNSISEVMDKKQHDLEAQKARKNGGNIVLQGAHDDTGLPVIIIRTPFSYIWERLPAVLQSVGMEITERNKPQGLINVTYKSSRANWSDLGVSEPSLKNGEYKLQVGDLENRSSVQFSTDKGQVVKDSDNDSLVTILQAAFNRESGSN
ncbi:MAG: outer membrane protein assembly factor BamC [Enterobacteriaceae bacterium]|jgi:outer membrane protein assembly factor BamC|nr:outer membrane protein assembly factor BamC [Enterobacteriaceae bacterium]